MGEGQFNIVDFARRIGLKNVRSMPVVESIQPVAIVGDQSDLTPSYAPAGGFFGGNAAAVVAVRSMIEIQSLGIGGMMVDAWVVQSVANILTQIRTGAALRFAAAPTLAGQTSNETPASIGRVGTIAAPAGDTSFLRPDHVYEIPFYVPRGDAFRMFPDTDNVSIQGTVWFHDVTASEHGPS